MMTLAFTAEGAGKGFRRTEEDMSKIWRKGR